MENYTYNKPLGIYMSNKSTCLNYIDGSESYLAKVFRSLKSIDSYPVDLQKYIRDWPSRYHLSYIRTNLFEAIAELLHQEWDVLEVGAGTGALTPWLCEKFKHVDCIEGALERAKTLSLRTKHLNNLRIFLGDIGQINLTKQYDLITLIGVLEYAPYYKIDQDPFQVCLDFLKRLSNALKENGIMIVAIENKLGAKYFTGCSEDHNGKMFSGLMDYPDRSPLTFSRVELENLLIKAGFQKTNFYHVFPDYKLPITIVREDSEIYEVGISGFIRGLFEDYSGSREYFFHDALFLHTIIKSKLLSHFSNSFLVLAAKSDVTKLETGWLVKKFSNREGMKPAFHHTISLIKHDSKYFIERQPLRNGTLSFNQDKIQFNILPIQQLVIGEPVLIEAYKCMLSQNHKDRLKKLLMEILTNLIKNFAVVNKDQQGYQMVQGDAIDYCFWNLVRDGNGCLHFIDTKWCVNYPIPADFVLFRNLLYLWQDTFPFIEESELSEFIMPIMDNLFSSYSLERFNENLDMETQFQNANRINPIKMINTKIDHLAKSSSINNLLIMKSLLQHKEEEMERIQKGRLWRIINKYFKIKNKIVHWREKC